MPESHLLSGLASATTALTHEVATGQRIGVDAVHVPTWRRHLELGGAHLIARTYTTAEAAFCNGRADRLSTRFAAKEAVLKVLGTGIRGVGLLDVEIVSEPEGRPVVVLHGPARSAADAVSLARIEVSLCHEDDYALAVAIGVGESQ